jgi:dephospho-CoA kinase
MIRLGLTGSIGMGKSTIAAMFAAEGVPVFDADAEVHRLQGPAGELVARIERHFPGTTGEAGVNRTALAEAVLDDPAALRLLESIVHPAVAAARERFLRDHRDKPLVLLDIPLLFERGGRGNVDKVAVVSAPAKVQRERVLARAEMTPQKFERILAIQMTDEEKCALADFVIPTGDGFETSRAAVRRIIACLTRGVDS